MTVSPPRLAARLAVMVLTDPAPACGRPLPEVVEECLRAGATAIQVRHKGARGAELLRSVRELLPLARRAGALLLVNDRFDVAAAGGADGVHLGPEDVPVAAVRRVVPREFLIGWSTDDPGEGWRAGRAGADYLGVGAVYGTRSKPGLEEEAIGPERVGEVLRTAGLPGVGIGGITPGNAAAVFATGAGVAVLSAVMGAERPGDVVRELVQLAAWARRA